MPEIIAVMIVFFTAVCALGVKSFLSALVPELGHAVGCIIV